MGLSNVLGKALVSVLPVRSELLYRFARKIVNRHDGDNDINMRTNGELGLMRERLPEARVVFDVGANVGDWTAEALKITARADYHCFEPSPTTFRTLAAKSFPPNVFRNNFGLSDTPHEAQLFVFSDECGANSLYARVGTDEVPKGEETIRLETIDGYCEARGIDRIDFLKLDVEGHELAALRGATGMLRERRIELVQFEYGGTYIDAGTHLKDMYALVDFIGGGYAIHKLFPDGLRRPVAYTQTLETHLYSNWVIVRT